LPRDRRNAGHEGTANAEYMNMQALTPP
jgi:hypothetical protein